MNLSPLAWQSLYVNYSFPSKSTPIDFWNFQVKAKQALNYFMQSEFGSLLILKTETSPEYIELFSDYFNLHQQPAIIQNEFDAFSLFGYQIYLEKENRTEQVNGIIQQADHKILVLNLTALLVDLSQWDKLKQALLFRRYFPLLSNPIPQMNTAVDVHFKLLLIGSREEIATLFNYDDTLYHFGQYSEIQSYLNLDARNFTQWSNYITTLADKFVNRSFSNIALNQLLNYFIRESGSQNYISISPTIIYKHLQSLSRFYPGSSEFSDISLYFDYLSEQSETLNQFVLQDILNHQIYIDTSGEKIGQINGLSVIEFDGVPSPFGEPLRISCNVQYGDGEIIDIERKVELGGNLHSKGMLIAQSCLANLLDLPSQLPFSASLAFEQSYGEVDGDSSALAIFCVLISALAKLPIPQSWAVTGSIDQFGNVLSVGGINQKIEGFFQLCQARGLTGDQAVIIPSACISQLSLNEVVVKAVKEGKFQVWAVDNVFDALSLLLKKFYSPEDIRDPQALFSLIHQHIEQQDEAQASGHFWQKIARLLRID